MKRRRNLAESNAAAWEAQKEKVPSQKVSKENASSAAEPKEKSYGEKGTLENVPKEFAAEQNNKEPSGDKPVWHSEDLALKTAAQYFGAELMPLLEMEKMQAILYTFADKFLNKNELDNVREVISMTTLGQMIFNDGLEKGIRAMVLDNLEEDVCDERICEKLQKHFSLTREEAEEKVRIYKEQEPNTPPQATRK